ncbi:MAG: hypothetical protein DRG25_05080 [Deltaproteobacteria bacterium]|nr:MAG: hypothetical protein DRG25_05080 [Deltaproteobacteria bacterium]
MSLSLLKAKLLTRAKARSFEFPNEGPGLTEWEFAPSGTLPSPRRGASKVSLIYAQGSFFSVVLNSWIKYYIYIPIDYKHNSVWVESDIIAAFTSMTTYLVTSGNK